MGKKRSKRISSNQSSLLNETSLGDESSFCEDNSAISSKELSSHFKVQLCHNTENKDEYHKWTKNCYWKNIAFIRPSALQDLGCQPLVLIRGASNCAAFIAQPLKSVKNGCVVLLTGMDFQSEERVTLHPLPEVREAQEVTISTQSSLLPWGRLQDMLVKKLSNRFIWCGLKLNLTLFGVQSECSVSKVLPNEEFSQSSHLGNQTGTKDISSLFSTLNLQESHLSEPVAATVDCYTTNHRSSVLVSDHRLDGQHELSFPLFQHLIGCHQQVETIRNCIETFLRNTRDAVQNCTCLLLLSGPSRSAKKMIADAICNEYSRIHAVRINMSSLSCKTASTALEEIKHMVRDADKSFPSFLVLDKFDLFCLLKTKDQVSALFRQMNKICGNRVLVVVAASSEFAVDQQLLSSFSVQEVKFTLPTTSNREEVVQNILIEQELSPSQIRQLAEMLQGLSSGDIFRILKFDALLLSLVRKKNAGTSESNVSICDIKTAIKKRKSYLLSSDLKANKVRWSDIGGMEAIKKELMEELALLTQTPKETLKRFNYSPSQGILLYGPPGCSKTMIAKALATECNWNFISKKASDLMNMYVGESEKAVANLFLEARLRAPCILFLDEIDAIAPSRNSSLSASGVQNRVVNCLLTEMAGIETLKDVLIIAATNRPDIIDDALLRRGRIGRLIYVPLPDAETRKGLFRLSMKKRQFSDDIDFDSLVQRTEGYTGAEIVQLCNEAAMQLLTEDCESPVLQKEHFELALLAVLPLTHPDTIHFYEQFDLRNTKDRGTSL